MSYRLPTNVGDRQFSSLSARVLTSSGGVPPCSVEKKYFVKNYVKTRKYLKYKIQVFAGKVFNPLVPEFFLQF